METRPPKVGKTYFRWRRNPWRQAVSIDRANGTVTYARACNASAEYYIVKGPLVEPGENDVEGLTDEQARFILHNLTPREYAVSIGGEAEEFDRSR